MSVPAVCSDCEKRFVANSTRQKRCPSCRLTRNHNVNVETEFIGVDGEGVTRPDGKHEYVLLSIGDRSLYHPDGSRLTWYDIIPFVWECFMENPQAAYVGFYLGYDFAHWLRDLPENRSRMLLTKEGIALRSRTKSGGNHVPFPVEHKGYSFDMLGMKRFRLWQNESKLRMYICDTAAFFQTSFLNVIDPANWPDGAVLTDEEYKIIRQGKDDRGYGTVEYGTPIDPDMIRYNIHENRVLGRLMKKLNEGMQNVGLRLKRDQWYGPGQAAQAWMNQIKAPTREQFQDATDVQIRKALQSSYYGGWFEIMAHGHIPGRSYGYDINSAYPDIQSKLPCCLHGTWRHGYKSDEPDSAYTVVYGTVWGSNPYIGSVPHRRQNGTILRPLVSKGWYWRHELDAGIKAGLIDKVEVGEWYSYHPCDCPPPFASERQLYLDRLKVGKNTVAGKARKLVYNSAYGKTAQSIGVAKYANPFYASLITSMCRTYILNSIALHPKGAADVLMVATDGVVFQSPNPNLALNETVLGQWSESVHDNLTLFMPGVYWDDRTRHKLREGEHPTLKSRGIPGKALGAKVLEIDALFSDMFSGKGFPVLEIPISFSLTSPTQALAWGKWELCANVQFDKIRTINSNPESKRAAPYLSDGIVRTYPYTQSSELETTPYTRSFGDHELDEDWSDDGDITMLLAHALKGE